MAENNPKHTDVNELGEFGLIDCLTAKNKTRNKSTILSVGDDAAVLDNKDYYTLLTTDSLVENIHFDLMYSPLKHLGYKSIVVNLSDIYAMNAIARQVLVSISISNRFSVEALEELYDGIYAACDRYNVDLIGGDTNSSPKGLYISVTAVGQGEPDRICYRSGAKVGDIICVTGDLGAAFLGLQLLEREKQIYLSDPNIQPNLEDKDYIVGRQLKPEARSDMIEFFRKAELIPTAMIDISDGLASDLFHICKSSDVGAFIEETGVPIRPDVQLQAIEFNLDPITCALNGGEDYELLFTIDPSDLEKVKYLPDVYIMGEITDKNEGVTLHTKGGKVHPIQAQGWQHFNMEED